MLSFGSHQIFIKGFLCNFSQSTQCWARKRIPKLIFHTILDVYPNISFIEKELSIAQKIMCEMTHHNKFGLVITSVNELSGRIVIILDNIIVCLY